MAVTVQLESEDGEILLYCPSATATEHLLDVAGSETPTLNGIDVYDELMFGREAFSSLLAESESVVTSMPADKRRDDAIKLVEFFRAAKEHPDNVHIRFIGD